MLILAPSSYVNQRLVFWRLCLLGQVIYLIVSLSLCSFSFAVFLRRLSHLPLCMLFFLPRRSMTVDETLALKEDRVGFRCYVSPPFLSFYSFFLSRKNKKKCVCPIPSIGSSHPSFQSPPLPGFLSLLGWSLNQTSKRKRRSEGGRRCHHRRLED